MYIFIFLYGGDENIGNDVLGVIYRDIFEVF